MIAGGCKYELSFISLALIDKLTGESNHKRASLLLDATTPSEVWQIQELHFATDSSVLGQSL